MKRRSRTNRSRPTRRLGVLSLCLVALIALGLVVATPALAYHTDPREGDLDCVDCHGDERDEWTGEGPHGAYTTISKKCRLCHSVHSASPDGVKLLPAATISDSCFTCHDGTGSVGVYSQITARGGTVRSEHRVEATSAIPGGSADLTAILSCGSCHSVHRATVLEPFLRDTGRAFGSKEYVYSNCLLRDDVNGAPKGTYTIYGAAWCASCHDLALVPVANHPMSTVATYTLGRSNIGFTDTSDEPYCQQCHEDNRDVEQPFSASLKDYGYPPPDAAINPTYTAFPHQSPVEDMLVEQYDDLCLNCHPVETL